MHIPLIYSVHECFLGSVRKCKRCTKRQQISEPANQTAEESKSVVPLRRRASFGKHFAFERTNDEPSIELSTIDQDQNSALERNMSKSATLSETPTMKHTPPSIPERVANKEKAHEIGDDIEEKQVTTTGCTSESTYFSLPSLIYSPSTSSLNSIDLETGACATTIFANPMLTEGEKKSNC